MKALVLLSGGLDSCVTLAYAVNKYGSENVAALSTLYGQKHAKELVCAQDIAKYYNVRFIAEDISNVMQYAKNVSSLMSGSEVSFNDKSYADQIKEDGSPSTEVPFRNGIFLSIAASIAMSIFPKEDVEVMYGAHSDDAAGNAYPDCSPEFADTMDKAIQIASRGKVKLVRPLINFTKSRVVKEGVVLGAPFELTWSCYHGGKKACGVCGTCRDRIDAFRANDLIDPIEYEGENPFADLRR